MSIFTIVARMVSLNQIKKWDSSKGADKVGSKCNSFRHGFEMCKVFWTFLSAPSFKLLLEDNKRRLGFETRVHTNFFFTYTYLENLSFASLPDNFQDLVSPVWLQWHLKVCPLTEMQSCALTIIQTVKYALKAHRYWFHRPFQRTS